MSNKGSSVTTGSTGLLTAGAVIALVAAAATYLTLQNETELSSEAVTALVRSTDQPVVTTAQPAPEAKSTSAPQETATPIESQSSDDGVSSKAVANDAVAPTETAALEDTPDADVERLDEAPRIDEVRVDQGGIMVVAGRAEPGSQIDVLVDGEVVSSAQVDSEGAFAALGTIQADDAARTLTLRADNGDAAVESDEEIILAPVVTREAIGTELDLGPVARVSESNETPEPVADLPDSVMEEVVPTQSDLQISDAVETVQNTVQDIEKNVEIPSARQPTVTAALDKVETAPGVTELAEKEKIGDALQEQVAALSPSTSDAVGPEKEAKTSEVAVLRSDTSGVSRVQTEPSDSVVLDTISYNDAGVVQLSGRAESFAEGVRVYLDNQPVARLTVSAEGNWRGEVPGVEAGVYTLRLDSISADGIISSRIETPFKRETPEVLIAARADSDGPISAITVQAGDTLWAIARDRYGEGVLYVQVFDANRNSIRDPDLIYPGQVFDLPAD